VGPLFGLNAGALSDQFGAVLDDLDLTAGQALGQGSESTIVFPGRCRLRLAGDVRIPEPGPLRDGGPGVSNQLSTKPKQDQDGYR
jgi:hypothetical protein